jgi:hypothetical protein
MSEMNVLPDFSPIRICTNSWNAASICMSPPRIGRLADSVWKFNVDRDHTDRAHEG